MDKKMKEGVISIIEKKRDGETLGRDEINSIVRGYVRGDIPDYQMSAFLMAVYIKGFTSNETTYLTEAMLNSGDIFDLQEIEGPKIDKHSTGGVGDKVSLILAPLVASCGIAVPMVSGRGLGHTGGTLDKLESINGFRTDLSQEEFVGILKKTRVVIMGQTEEFVPADKKIYALRDVTATVSSIPLITASIMSKKLAEGIDGLILDVKTGSGAFMRDIESARELASAMVEIGRSFGKEIKALITNMDEPLGYAVGNALEVKEAVDVLMGKEIQDIKELTLELGSEMLVMAKLTDNRESAREMLEESVRTGTAYEKWNEMVKAQGGDPECVFKDEFIETRFIRQVKSKSSGFLYSFDTKLVGTAVVRLGGGRMKKEDKIDPKVGIIMRKKVGEPVEEGDCIFEVRGNDRGRMEGVIEILDNSYKITSHKPAKTGLIFDRL